MRGTRAPPLCSPLLALARFFAVTPLPTPPRQAPHHRTMSTSRVVESHHVPALTPTSALSRASARRWKTSAMAGGREQRAAGGMVVGVGVTMLGAAPTAAGKGASAGRHGAARGGGGGRCMHTKARVRRRSRPARHRVRRRSRTHMAARWAQRGCGRARAVWAERGERGERRGGRGRAPRAVRRGRGSAAQRRRARRFIASAKHASRFGLRLTHPRHAPLLRPCLCGGMLLAEGSRGGGVARALTEAAGWRAPPCAGAAALARND